MKTTGELVSLITLNAAVLFHDMKNSYPFDVSQLKDHDGRNEVKRRLDYLAGPLKAKEIKIWGVTVIESHFEFPENQIKAGLAHLKPSLCMREKNIGNSIKTASNFFPKSRFKNGF